MKKFLHIANTVLHNLKEGSSNKRLRPDELIRVSSGLDWDDLFPDSSFLSLYIRRKLQKADPAGHCLFRIVGCEADLLHGYAGAL